MLMAALVVLIIFALSARRERVKDQTDLQSMARAVTMLLAARAEQHALASSSP